VSSGHTTWYELACEIRRQVASSSQIDRVFAADLKTAARRPTFCALANRKLLDLGIDMPTWQSTIERHLTARGIALVGNAIPL
jgi:dTDP-4-dehydrorhamnose reductase